VIGKKQGVPKDVPAREEAKEKAMLPAPPVLVFKAPAAMVVVMVCISCGDVYGVEEVSSNE
jgi:hypothetical protein